MRTLIILILILLAKGAVLTLVRQARQEQQSRAAIERMLEHRVRPGSGMRRRPVPARPAAGVRARWNAHPGRSR